VPARAQSVALVRHAVLEFAAERGAADGRLAAIGLAVSEAVSNAVTHAYVGFESPGMVACEAEVDERMLRVIVTDEGVGMRPRLDSPGLGLGLGLIASLTERLELTEMQPGVRVRMTFPLD
jgi:serine/threonine-protein kinase RsbW/stage II sporulation protein AB (anti-sigma F factor)